MNVKTSFQRPDGDSPDSGIDEGVVTSPAEIDARRAHHSLERAMQLAERGDLAAAITACRQSIALAHEAPEGYSALGLLLERAGDRQGAMGALQKSVQLAPGNALDRASLERLQSENSGAPGPFQFNDDELFAPTDSAPVASSTNAVNVPVAAAVVSSTNAANASAAPVVSSTNAAVSIDARLPPTRAEVEAMAAATLVTTTAIEPTVAAAPVASTRILESAPVPNRASAKPLVGNPSALDASPFTPTGERRVVNVPVSQERRAPASSTTRYEVPPLSAIAPNSFAFEPVAAPARAPLWAQLLRQPSFFGRTLPLVAVTLFSLGFLSWARARAVDKAAEQNPVTVSSNVDSQPIVDSGETTTQTPENTSTTGGVPNPNGSFPISNVPGAIPPTGTVIGGPQPQPVAPATQPAAPVSATNSGANNGRATSPATAPRTAPRTSPAANTGTGARTRPNGVPSIPPASIVPAPPSTRPLVLPPPQIGAPTLAEAPVRVLPSNSGAPVPNVGGAPLRPGGAPGRGYVRVQGGRLGSAPLPQRPGATARGAEQGAGAAARTGQTNQAIERITAAINADPSDAGFRLQQRASLFLDNSDFTRAADDYQAAISAYQDQINRGENVATARAGLRSARSGLNLALAAAGRNR